MDFSWVRDHVITPAKVWGLDQRDTEELEEGRHRRSVRLVT